MRPGIVRRGTCVGVHVSVARVISGARAQIVCLIGSTPDDHFTPGPQRCVVPSCRRRVDGADRCPTIGARIVSAPSVQPAVTTTSDSAPDDHLAAGPDCRVRLSCGRRVGGAGRIPSIGVWIISAAGVRNRYRVVAAPDDHLAAGPYCACEATRAVARWRCWWQSNYP